MNLLAHPLLKRTPIYYQYIRLQHAVRYFATRPLMEVESITNRQSLKLIQDPRDVEQFRDFKQLPTHVLEKLDFYNMQKPTKLQKDMLSVLYSGGSVLARSHPGLGKSTSGNIYLVSQATLNDKRPSNHIDALVIVPSLELGNQATSLLRTFTDLSAQDIQHIYRSNDTDEVHQLAQLQKHTPRILIAQPSILLDFLCDETARELIPLQNLSVVAVEEIDTFYQTSPKDKHDKPLSILMNFVVQITSRHRAVHGGNPAENNKENQADSLTFILTSSSQDKSFVKQEWIAQNRRPLIEIGGSTTKSTDNLIHLNDCSNGEIKEIALSDLPNAAGCAAPREIATDIDFTHYIDSVNHLLARNEQKLLVLIPSTMSMQKAVNEFRVRGIPAISISSEVPFFHYRDINGEIEPVDHETLFLTNDSLAPRILLSKMNPLSGLNFPGLGHIVLITPFAATTPQDLVNLRYILRSTDNESQRITILADMKNGSTQKALAILVRELPEDCITSGR